MKIKTIFIFLLFMCNDIFSLDSENYNTLLIDLKNYNTIAYKPTNCFVREETTTTSYKYVQGKLWKIDRQLSFALQCDGFVQIYNSDGEVFYTRACSFTIDENGSFRSGNGMFFLPTVRVNENELMALEINRTGIVKLIYPGKTEEYKISLFVPTDDSKNIFLGNYYKFSKVKNIEENLFFIQGFIELSCVNSGETIVKMQESLFNLVNDNLMDSDEYNYKSILLNELFAIMINIDDKYKNYNFLEQTLQIENQHLSDTTQYILSLLSLRLFDCQVPCTMQK